MQQDAASEEWRAVYLAKTLWNSSKERLKGLRNLEGKIVACKIQLRLMVFPDSAEG